MSLHLKQDIPNCSKGKFHKNKRTKEEIRKTRNEKDCNRKNKDKLSFFEEKKELLRLHLIILLVNVWQVYSVDERLTLNLQKTFIWCPGHYTNFTRVFNFCISNDVIRIMISVRQISSDFGFGAAVDFNHLLNNPGYKSFIKNNFGWATLENSLKWDYMEHHQVCVINQ